MLISWNIVIHNDYFSILTILFYNKHVFYLKANEWKKKRKKEKENLVKEKNPSYLFVP